MIIDAWMQHPSAEFLAEPMVDSLRRWARGRPAEGEIPVGRCAGPLGRGGPDGTTMARIAERAGINK